MNRRILIKQLIFVTGGALFLPSCLGSDKNNTIKYKYFTLTQAQLMLMSGLSETVLPLSEPSQASGEKLYLFVIKMVDECLTSEQQQFFLSGLAELQHFVDEKYHDHSHLTAHQNTLLISKLEKQQFSENITEFYKIFKKQLISAYQNSAYFMKHVIEYKLIPGSYQVHVSLV